ncbi:hypothetical protein ACIPSE_45040 [Streptomyces sp. NPDC090106]|uniref:hypothetical protein n=1 Tax=Streptomyces sp. NPDC090106 TaxID=3365946 RepID=UPI00382BBEFF
MADEQHDVLLHFWQEQRNQARQSENQRATLTNIVLIVASGAIGLVVHQGVTDRSSLAVTVGLTILGSYGTVASMKFRERYALHMHEAKLMRRRLDALCPGLGLETDRQTARESHIRRHPRLYRIRLHYIWTALHVGIALAGAILTVIIAV